MKVLCIVTNGFEEVEFVGTVGILRRGNVDIDIFSIHGSKAIGRYGIEVSNLYNFKDIDVTKYDLLLIPGGPEYVEMENNMEFLNIIKYFYNSNKYIAAICAGPTILGHLGMLKNKKYTCFTSMNEDFGGEYVDTYVVKDGKIITANGAGNAMTFALYLLAALQGEEKALEVGRSIQIKL